MTLLREGMNEAMFIGHGMTVERFRRLYDMGTLFRYDKLNSWLENGRKSLKDDAKEELAKIVAVHDFHLGES